MVGRLVCERWLPGSLNAAALGRRRRPVPRLVWRRLIRRPPGGRARLGRRLLGSLLALERAVIAAYNASVPVLRADALQLSREIRAQEEDHVAGRAGDPRPRRRAARRRSSAEYERQFHLHPRPTPCTSSAKTSRSASCAATSNCPGLPELELRTMAAEIGEADEGEQLAVVRVLGGGPASPHPFETGAL